jgi:phage head maturation protease
LDDIGLVVHCQITDPEVRGRMQTGELRGFSFGALIYDSECSVCGRQYADCNHNAGEIYKGAKCIAHASGADLAEVSVVARPANPLARVVRGD